MARDWRVIPLTLREEARPVLWDLFVATYAKLGLVHKRAAELDEYDRWDLHRRPDGEAFDAFQLWKRTPLGFKMGLGGSDGSHDARKALVALFLDVANRPGHYGEVSHRVEDILTEANVSAVCVAYVGGVLKKSITPLADGMHYERKISGLVDPVRKVMVGRPVRIPTTHLARPACPVSLGGLRGISSRTVRATRGEGKIDAAQDAWMESF